MVCQPCPSNTSTAGLRACGPGADLAAGPWRLKLEEDYGLGPTRVVQEGLGWTIHRIWSTDWVRDPDAQIRAVEAALARARQGWRPSPPAVQIAIELPNPSKPLGSGRKELRFPPYRTVELPRNNRTSIHEESPEKLRLLVTRVVEAEGPVHIDLLTERLRRHYGAGRAGRQIQTAIESAAKAESRLGRIYWRGDFLDASQQPVRPEPRGAAQDGSVRNIEHIWEGEIEAGVLQIVEAAFGISREDAVVAAARAFGYDRVGPKIRETVQQVVERLLAKGEIAETPAGLTTPS